MTETESRSAPTESSHSRISGQDVHAMWGGEVSVREGGSMTCVEGLSKPVSIVRNTCTGRGIYRRSARAVRKFEQPFHAITFVESGELAIFPSHDVIRIERGQFMVTKTSTGYQAEMLGGADPFFDNYTVRVPDHRMIPHFPAGIRYGQAMSASEGPGAAARDLAMFLFTHGTTLPHPEIEALTDIFLERVARAVEREHAQLPPRQTARERHLKAIHEIIGQHISDPGLSLGDIARKLKISTRYIILILAEDGLKFRDLLRGKRMDLARRLLTNLDADRYPIARISYLCGFKNPSHFSTAFKESVGMTASDFRKARLDLSLR